MDIYILMKMKYQGNYTEPRHWSSAEDSGEIAGVFQDRETAEEEKLMLDMKLPEICEDDYDEYGEYAPEEDRYYYKVVEAELR